MSTHLDMPIVPIIVEENNIHEASQMMRSVLNLAMTREWHEEALINSDATAFLMSILETWIVKEHDNPISDEVRKMIVVQFVEECVHLGYLMGRRSIEREVEKND